MPSAADRLDLAPQPDPGALRSFGLALLVHALLIGALAWGINWKHSDPDLSFEAELWSSVPQEAAPKLVEPPPAPPPPPPPPPEPVVKAPPPPPAPDVDIALEREKKRKLELKKKEAELAKAKAEQDKLKELQAKKEKEQKAKEELAKRKAAEEAKKLEAKKAEDKKQDAKNAEKQKLADAATKKLRDDAMKRMMAQAGATGGTDARGTAQVASGPSASYRGRLAALFKRNINFPNPDSISGNPKAVVQVKVSSAGVILSRELTKSSGVPAWDQAVLRAVDKAERIPLDENGKVVPEFPVEFGPKD